MKSNNLINIGVVILAVTLGYLFYQWTHKPEIVVQRITLTNFEKQRLIADARKGWISPDSAKALTNGKIKPLVLINWKDSLRIIDSTVTKDSTIYSFEESNYHFLNDSLFGKGYVKFNEEADFKVPVEKSISLTNIESIQQDEMNASGTTWLLVGGILLVDIMVFGIQAIAYLSGI